MTDLIVDNYQLWGGRYNPIIPVVNGTISSYYQNQISEYDPDIVYYSRQIDFDIIKKYSKKFQAAKYEILDDEGRNSFPGVYAHYLLSDNINNDFHFNHNMSLVYFNHHVDEPLTSFYNLSFGISNRYAGDSTYAKGYKIVDLDILNISETNRLIHTEKPYFGCLFSEKDVNIKLFRPTSDWEFHCFELIIYDSSNHFEDLIYFWNRKQFQRPENKVKQIIISKEQLSFFIADPFFVRILRDLSPDGNVYLVSFSISYQELEEQKNLLQTSTTLVHFDIALSRLYPRAMDVGPFPYIKETVWSKNLLIGTKDFLKLPVPLLNRHVTLTTGTYIYDIEFRQEAGDNSNKLKIPYGTSVGFLLANHSGRINREHNVSFFLTGQIQGIDLNVPSEIDIFRSRLHARIYMGELIYNPVENIQFSDAGRKLSAFVDLFGNNLRQASEFVKEQFWVDLILGITTGKKKTNIEFKRNSSVSGSVVEDRFHVKLPASPYVNFDGVFSYEDLKAERRIIYFEHLNKIKLWLESHQQNLTDDDLNAFIEKSIEEDFKRHIDSELQFFVDNDALFMGMKVKCYNCGSKSWYPLRELSNKLPCKGCFKTIVPAVQSHLYYKFNDVILNNISSDPVKRSKNFNGNYIVLKTLGNFAESHKSHESFLWTPSVDVLIHDGTKPLTTDIDLLMIQNGELIIGEAKADTEGFTTLQFEQLRKIAVAIRPDKIILAYSDGALPLQKIEDLRTELSSIGCEIIIHKIFNSHYYFGRLGIN
jgi:hypothetical protein